MRKALLIVLLSVPVIAVAADKSIQQNANEMFSECDANRDGKISKEEFNQEKNQKFSKYDTNGDGMLSKEEHEKMASDMHEKLMHGKSRT